MWNEVCRRFLYDMLVSLPLSSRQTATYSWFSFSAGSVVDRWSDVGVTTTAGVLTSVVLAIAPRTAPVLGRLVVLGTYFGTIVWVLKKLYGIQAGQDVFGSW